MLGIHKGVTERISLDGSLLIRSAGNPCAKTARCRSREKSLTRNWPPDVERDGEADLRANPA